MRSKFVLVCLGSLLALAIYSFFGHASQTEQTPTRGSIPSQSEASSTREASLASSTHPAESDPSAERTELSEPVAAGANRDYGYRLQRSNSKLMVTLLDSRGMRLSIQPHFESPRIQIWRKLGSYWMRSESHPQLDSGTFTSQDLAYGFGLEPGEYEFQFSLGSYGKIKGTTYIRRGTEHQVQAKLLGYNRVIKLLFVDQAGNRLLHLPHKPYFSHGKTVELAQKRKAPTNRLREPPGALCFSSHDSAVFSSRCSAAKPVTRFATDHGAVYLQVVAGQKGQISMANDKILLATPWTGLTSDFEGPAWEQYQVVLKTSADYRQQLRGRRTTNPNDPGNHRARQGTRSSAPYRPQPNPLDLATLKRGQGRITASAPAGFHVGARLKSGRRNIPKSVDEYTWDVPEQSKVHICATDGRLAFVDEWVDVDAAGGIQHVSLSAQLRPARLKITLPPSVAAWGHSLVLSLSAPDGTFLSIIQCAGEMEGIEIKGRRTITVDLQVNTSPGAPNLEGASLMVGVSPMSSTANESSWRHQLTRENALFHPVPLTATALAKITTNEGLAVDLHAAPLLAMRCVGASGEGLPWVQISIVDADQDECAQAVRDAAKLRLREDPSTRRPNVAQLVRKSSIPGVVESEEEEWEEVPEELLWFTRPSVIQDLSSVFDGGPRAALGPEIALKTYGQTLLRRYGTAGINRLHRFNAWYNTFRMAKSDSFGYILCRLPKSPQLRLIPKKRYVIYLWSNSRDDLAPDRRLEFVAQAGTTDLGVIEVPSYSSH